MWMIRVLAPVRPRLRNLIVAILAALGFILALNTAITFLAVLIMETVLFVTDRPAEELADYSQGLLYVVIGAFPLMAVIAWGCYSAASRFYETFAVSAETHE